MSLSLPYHRSYWVEPGRLLAGFFPGAAQPAAADAKLSALLACGVTHFVNLMEEDEVNYAGESFAPYAPRLEQLAAELGRSITCRRLAVVDRSIPSVALMREILDAIDGAEARGEITYVHCWGGRGRTGTVVACYLRRRHGMSAEAALARVEELTREKHASFWPTPEVGSQRAFVAAWKELA